MVGKIPPRFYWFFFTISAFGCDLTIVFCVLRILAEHLPSQDFLSEIYNPAAIQAHMALQNQFQARLGRLQAQGQAALFFGHTRCSSRANTQISLLRSQSVIFFFFCITTLFRFFPVHLITWLPGWHEATAWSSNKANWARHAKALFGKKWTLI